MRAERPSARWTAPLVGAVDAAVAVALPFGVLVLAALVAWAGLGAAAPWTVFLAGAADVWFLGHGVDVTVPASPAFPVTIALLGPALGTLLLGVRAGRRAVATALPGPAAAAGVLVVLLASALLLLLAKGAPAPVQALVLPALVYGAGLTAGLRPGRGLLRAGPLAAGLRGGAGAAAVVLAAAALAVVVLLATHLPAVVGLYESSSAGIAGGLALTVLQVALLPTVVVWAGAWLTGAGFALGAGSSVGPLGTAVGPLPSLPLLGALPQGVGPFGLAAILVPVLAGVGFGVALRLRADGPVGAGASALAAAVAGAVAGLLLGALSLAASGAIGPGRLATVGPDALQVAWRAAVEVGVGALAGVAAVRRRERGSGPAEGAR
ncbi:MAG: cell division protein PerM [Amnibacterium sp.]